LVGGFVLGMPNRHTNNFPESGRGLGHVTPAIFGSTVGYPSDSLASCSYRHCTDCESFDNFHCDAAAVAAVALKFKPAEIVSKWITVI